MTDWQTTSWRLSRLEHGQEVMETVLRDHDRRLTVIETTTRHITMAQIKEMCVLLIIGAMLGAMVVTKDPAGVAALLASVRGG